MIAAVWAGITAPRMVDVAEDWEQLIALLSNSRATFNKSAGRLWSPVTLCAGATTRANANIEFITALVLDFDGGERWNDVRKNLDGEWIAYSSFSHSGWGDRFHVVKRLPEPVPASAWAATYRKMANRYGKADHLPALSHSYYLPQHQPGMAHFMEVSK
jgi:hypothetical protein